MCVLYTCELCQRRDASIRGFQLSQARVRAHPYHCTTRLPWQSLGASIIKRAPQAGLIQMGDLKLRSEVDAILRNHITAGGASVAIASSQAEPFCFHTGLADIKTSKPVDSTHLFGIGSITKVFVAVVVLQLVEEGKLALQDTVQEHFIQIFTAILKVREMQAYRSS